MITPEQSAELKDTIGGNITPKVKEKLADRGITGPGGKPYSQSTINAVLNGKRNNDVIESILIDLYDEKVREWVDRNRKLGILND